MTSPITPDPSIHRVPAKIQSTQTGTPLPANLLVSWGQKLLNSVVSQIVSALTFGLVKPGTVNDALVGLENWWQGILDGFAFALGLKPGTGSGTGETGTPSSGSGEGAGVPGRPTVQDVFDKIDSLRGDATEAGTGLIPGHRIPVIPVSHLGADSPNLLIGGGFDDEKNLDPAGDFTWNGVYGRTKPGCAQVIPDGTDHVLYSNPIDVLSEQTFEVGGYVRWLLIEAAEDETAIQVSVAAYAGSTLKSTTPIYTIVNPVAMTSLTTWRELAGTWTYNDAVDPTVDNIRLKLLVSHNVTSTYAGYGYVWWDDLAAYKLGILKGHLVTGLTSGGTETTIVDDLQGTLDHAVDGINNTYGTTGTTLGGFRGVHYGHKLDSNDAYGRGSTGITNAATAQDGVNGTWNTAVDGYYNNATPSTGKTLADFRGIHRGHKLDANDAYGRGSTGVTNAATAQSGVNGTWNAAYDGYYNNLGTPSTGKTLTDYQAIHRGHKFGTEQAQTTATDANNLAEGSLAAGSNLCSNPEFENIKLSTDSAGRGGITSATAGVPVGAPGGIVRTGTYAAYGDALTGSTTSVFFTTNTTGRYKVPCIPYDWYYLEVYVCGKATNSATSGTISLVVDPYNKDGSALTTVTAVSITPSAALNGAANWTKISGYAQMPATVTHMSAGVRISGVPTGNTFYFDNPVIREVTDAKEAGTLTSNLQTSIVNGYTVYPPISSTQTFTIPDNLSEFYVILFGAGANGGTPLSAGSGGSGGAAGDVIATQLDSKTLPAAGTAVTCTVGSSSSPVTSFGTIVSTNNAYKSYVSTPLGLQPTVNAPSAGGTGGFYSGTPSNGSAGAATASGLAGGAGGTAFNGVTAGTAGAGSAGGSGVTFGLTRTGGSGGGGGGGASSTGGSIVVTGGKGGAGGFPGGGGGGGGAARASLSSSTAVFGAGGVGGGGMIQIIYKLATTT